MRKVLIGLFVIILLIAAIPVGLLVTGTVDKSSLRMVLNVMTGMGGPSTNVATAAGRYRVPEGFSLSVYASDLPRARFMRFTPGGDLLLSRPHSGDVLLLRRDRNGDGRPDAVETLLQGLKRPLGIDFAGDWLYVAESNQVGRVPFDSAAGKLTGDYLPVIKGLTDDGNHWSKTIRIGADNLLYLAQGSTCNVCEEQDSRRATMMRFQLDGSQPEVISTGLRNSVGFDWAPWSGELFATDNGRDLLGDDFPPCELNRIQSGKFYGWPYYNGDNIEDPDMGRDPLRGERQPTAPAHGFRPHNAPLGITFPDTSSWPAQFQQSALVALHGSWNRSSPDGYKVVSLHWTADGIQERDFLAGFNQDGDISGRPVDVAQGPDGAIYISDDYAGAIYRVSYGDSDVTANMSTLASSQSRLDTSPPHWLENADLAALSKRGAALYDQYQCRSCHEQGENPALLTDLSSRLGYRAVIETLEAPQSPMPVFPLSDEERRALAVYLLAPEQ